MILYRMFHAASDVFPLAALGVYVLLFVVTFIGVFLFPPLGLVIFFMSLASVPFVWVISRGLIAAESSMALRAMAAGKCPECAKRMQVVRDPARTWRCEFCETRFLTDGRVLSDNMILSPEELGSVEAGEAVT
ncbi:MAG: hypothetical protein AB8G96_02215 [Phycisphaerales bacterium]